LDCGRLLIHTKKFAIAWLDEDSSSNVKEAGASDKHACTERSSGWGWFERHSVDRREKRKPAIPQRQSEDSSRQEGVSGIERRRTGHDQRIPGAIKHYPSRTGKTALKCF
jgi:hypothetical protein